MSNEEGVELSLHGNGGAKRPAEIMEVWLRGVWSSNLDNEQVSEGFTLAWSAKGVGFGELNFSFDHKNSRWTCDTETMSREFVKAVLAKLGDCYEVRP